MELSELVFRCGFVFKRLDRMISIPYHYVVKIVLHSSCLEVSILLHGAVHDDGYHQLSSINDRAITLHLRPRVQSTDPAMWCRSMLYETPVVWLKQVRHIGDLIDIENV